MDLTHVLSRASGTSHQACHAILLRSPPGRSFSPGEGDSWLVSWEGNTVSTHLKKAGWYTDVYRSAAGRVYVTDADGFVQHGAATSAATTWEAHHLGATLQGIWGLDDTHVFAWGLGPRQQTVMFEWDGSRWKDIPAPDASRRVLALHGARPDLVVAVGRDGLIARYDGRSWHSMAAPSETSLNAVFVVDDDEMYACGQEGALIQGSVHGWHQVLRGADPLMGVCKWSGQVWVASWGDRGLSTVEGATLRSRKPNIRAIQLAAAERMLYVTPEKVGSTGDAEKYNSYDTSVLARLTASTAPLWT